jgi:hypothetical protein
MREPPCSAKKSMFLSSVCLMRFLLTTSRSHKIVTPPPFGAKSWPAEAAVHFVGLAPLVRLSGTSVHGRSQISRCGHGRVRSQLYLATLTAARFNPIIKAYYDRLRAAGKPMKVARCACARKLLHIAFAVVTREHAFDPDYQAAGKSQAEQVLAAW